MVHNVEQFVVMVLRLNKVYQNWGFQTFQKRGTNMTLENPHFQ